jgi:hypothetical protein
MRQFLAVIPGFLLLTPPGCAAHDYLIFVHSAGAFINTTSIAYLLLPEKGVDKAESEFPEFADEVPRMLAIQTHL